MKKLFLLSCFLFISILFCNAQNFNEAFNAMKEELDNGDDFSLQLYFNGETKLGIINLYNDDIKMYPDSMELYYDRANYYLYYKEYDAAILDYTVYLKKRPNDTKVLSKRSDVYFTIGNYVAAIADYTRNTKLNPNESANWINRSNAYFKIGEYELALSDLTNALQVYTFELKFRKKDILQLKSKIYDIYCKSGKYELALADLTKVLKLDPKNYKAWEIKFNIYKDYAKQDKYKSAFADIDKVLQIDPEDKSAWQLKCKIYIDQGKFDTAIADFTRALEKYPALSILYRCRAQIYEKQGNYSLAFKDYANPIQEDKSFIQDQYINKYNEFINNGRIDLAVKLLENLEEYNYKPENNDGTYKFNRLNKLGEAYYLNKEYDKAENCFIKVLSFEAFQQEAIVGLSNTYLAQSKYDVAVEILKQTILTQKGSDLMSDYEQKLALFYCFNYQFDLASKLLLALRESNGFEMINRDPNDAISKLETEYLIICREYVITSDYQNALINLNRAINKYQLSIDSAIDKSNDVIYTNIVAQTGWMYEKTGNNEKALEYYKKARILNPFTKNVDSFISILEQKINAEIVTDKTPPTIQLLTPKIIHSGTVENDVNKSNQLFVSGIANDISGIASVSINGTIVNEIKESGYFSFNIDGSVNKIIIQVSDKNGNVTNEIYQIDKATIPVNASSIPLITTEDKPAYHAVLIACSNYIGKWPQLPSTLTEAKEMKDLLSKKYGFIETNILELYNKDYSAILTNLSAKLESLKENDNLIIYFAGHGTYKQKGTELVGYWVPLNTTNIDVDYISNKKLNELVAGTKTKHILILSDACYSGAMRSNNEIKPPSKLEYKLRSRQILTSGGLEKVPGESVFMKMVMKVLQLNTEKYFPVSDLYNSIFSGVKKQTDNEPKLNDFGKDGNEGGQFYFMLNN
jgi:tetratricopeptide (TPR) repeat protein